MLIEGKTFSCLDRLKDYHFLSNANVVARKFNDFSVSLNGRRNKVYRGAGNAT